MSAIALVTSTREQVGPTQCLNRDMIPAQTNLKAMKARIPSPTPFCCFTNKNETLKIVSPIKNRRRPSGSERANETAKQ